MVMTKDGAKTLSRALDSALAARCFERILIMIDTRSTDGTGMIATDYLRKYPAIVRVIGHNWRRVPDFAEARNRMIDHSMSFFGTDYGSWLDDDEVIVDPQAYRTILNRATGAAYLVWVISPTGKGQSHDMFQPRIFPFRHGVRFECPVFERLDFSLSRLGIPMIATTYKAIHHPGYMDRDLLIEKNRRNFTIAADFLRRASVKEQREHIQTQYQRMGGR